VPIHPGLVPLLVSHLQMRSQSPEEALFLGVQGRRLSPTVLSRTFRYYATAAETSWWSGDADITTFESEELLATKLRALYQRSKGRDLFDLWLGLTVLGSDPERIVAGLHHYMRDGIFSFPELRDNLTAKLANASFRRDLDALVTSIPPEYDPNTAADIVMRELGSRLRNAPPVEEIGPLRV
jgi:Nucleotidyl transferase AbiEii toxin, Type IV TA system